MKFTRSKINLFVILFIGLGMPGYYKTKSILKGELPIEFLLHWSNLIDVLFAITLASLIVFGHENIVRVLRNIFPEKTSSLKRLIYQLISTSFYCLVATYTYTHFFCTYIIEWEVPSDYMFDMLILSLFIPILINGITESLYFYGEWEKESIKKERLKEESIRAKFDVLKNQINPHFLFNSFNTLSFLIKQGKDVAIQFLEQLSKVYRFILEQNQNEVITLSEELDILHSYLYLLKLRYGDRIDIHINIPEKYLSYYIAPVTFQILLENVFKHNFATKEAPIFVSIEVDGGMIIFKNNLQKKDEDYSTHTGLKNIKNRYNYLSDVQVTIEETEDEFRVSIPLIGIETI